MNQNELLRTLRILFPKKTYKQMAEETGIEKTRLFRIFHGYEMKISEYFSIKKLVDENKVKEQIEQLRKFVTCFLICLLPTLANANPIETHANLAPKNFKESVVIYNFWATWCAPCLVELPGLARISKKYPKELKVVSIGLVKKGLKHPDRIWNKLDHNFLMIKDTDRKLSKEMGIKKLPVTLIYQKGVMVKEVHGELNFESPEIIEIIQKSI